MKLIVFDDGYDDDEIHDVCPREQIPVYVILMPSITPIWIPTPRLKTLLCYSVRTPFISTLRRGTVDTPKIQYVIKGGRVVR